MATQQKKIGRDYPLSPTPEPMPTDNTSVSKVIPSFKNLQDVSLVEKVKIAKQLYKDNPSKVFKDAVDKAEKNLTNKK